MGSRPILQALLRHPDAQHIKKGGQKMNVPSKRTSRMISMLLVLTMLMGLLTVSVSAQPAAQGSKVEDAILYTINADNELEYNVVYSSAMTEATHVSGEGISSIDELKTALGTPDDLGDAITAI